MSSVKTNEPLSAIPTMAAAVISTLAAVTCAVPNRKISRALIRPLKTVPAHTTALSSPAREIPTPRSACMAGQTDPSSESGRPRLMKAT